MFFFISFSLPLYKAPHKRKVDVLSEKSATKRLEFDRTRRVKRQPHKQHFLSNRARRIKTDKKNSSENV